MYKHIAAHHSIDLIYWTGDLPPHDIWKQSRQGNVEVESNILQGPHHLDVSQFGLCVGGAPNCKAVEGALSRSDGPTSSWKSRVGPSGLFPSTFCDRGSR